MNRKGDGCQMHAGSQRRADKQGILDRIFKNDIGNAFWHTIGWTERLDLNYYDFVLNEENIIEFNK